MLIGDFPLFIYVPLHAFNMTFSRSSQEAQITDG